MFSGTASLALVIEKLKLFEPLNQYVAVVLKTIHCFRAFDTVKKGDICWQKFLIFPLNGGNKCETKMTHLSYSICSIKTEL